MGKVNVLEIILSNATGVYLAGQLLQGHVNLELNTNMKLRDIRLQVRGKAFVHWTEQLMRGPGESRFREIRHHSSTEEYVEWSQSLLGRTSGSSSTRELAAGQYTYPFQFQLPSNVPTSFEGQYGYLRYWVKVTIGRPCNNDQSAQKIFTLISPVDLNREPSAASSVQAQKQKRLCCLCCRSGPVSAVMGLSHRGFVPGETIHVNAEVTNSSRRKMSGSSVALMMTVLYHTPNKSRALTQQVTKMKHGPIPAGDSDLWEQEKLVIPPLPPSNLNGCSIIDIKYTLELRVDPVGPAFELHVPIEVIIGTVPLHAVVQRYLATHQIAPPSPQRHVHFNQAALGGHVQQLSPGHAQQLTPGHAQQLPPAYAQQLAQGYAPHLGGHAQQQHAAADAALNRQPHYVVPPRYAHYVFGHTRRHDDQENENTRSTRSENGHYTPVYVYYTWMPEEVHLRRQQGVRFAA